MNLELVGAVLGVLAATIFNVGTVAQIRLAARDRGDCVGVSMVSAGMICVTCAGWGVYALERNLWVAVASCVCGVVMWGTILFLVATRARLSELAWPTALLAVLCAVWFLAGTTGVGVVLLLDGAVTTVPQLWRVRRGEAGVSALTWATAAIAASCWVVYGAVNADALWVGAELLRAVLAAAIAVIVVGQNARRVPVRAAQTVHATL